MSQPLNQPSPRSIPLLCHPATPCAAISRVEVALGRAADGGLTLAYAVDAEAGALLLPAPVAETDTPTDGLWRHTCCEAFVSRQGSAAYREFNFSPSGAWAAYAFAATRERDEAAESWRSPPPCAFFGRAGGFALRAVVPASQLPESGGALQLGLSVVLETAAGLSYWALVHPAPQPDFHHRAAFALTLD